MRLYIVFARDPNGESLDWFVRAHFARQLDACLEFGSKRWSPTACSSPTHFRSMEVPAVEGPEGAIEWESSLIAI